MRLTPLQVEPVNLRKQAADVLREAIISAELHPGARLIEEDIARQLGVSRMPIREAIQQLSDEGLVEKIPGRGAFVQRFYAKDVEELYAVRVVLESFAIELLMSSDSREHITRLHKVVDEMTEAAQQGDKLRLFQLDAQFHEALVTLTGYSLLQEILTVIRSRISRLLLQGIKVRSQQDLMKHVEKHRRLLELIEATDVNAAKEELRVHILEGKSRITADYGDS